ncbi:MAG: hypothetical protein A3C07_04735 [Candidatus Sungbacteria bacterium RIFCSPHIGHO2_02_FULL_47_11]|uniref:Rod shape-determining protein RodA n=1 Tax=Candidatus Sungbacteria bacterium RIFCSPHIGHO2_02_FULL_47_11 TaxID=1802270 RepID=A0A1G2KHJ5_9BACT|nr:MAG: hypothetical protein A3C07_04735 [Candidatus Sungbacteria bacterium RIFCSPHIGHO2_02_FULL_47_11]
MGIGNSINVFGLRVFQSIDWILFSAVVAIAGAGLLTMSSFAGEDYFFSRQITWVVLSFIIFFLFSGIDWRFLKRTGVLVVLFSIATAGLLFLFVVGHVAKGAQSWFQIGGFTFQPSDPVKILLIAILAKYFSVRHIEIANVRHILVSGFYALVPALLVFLQPDFGSAIIIFSVWFGMILVAGVSKKHLLFVFVAGIASLLILWSFVFEEYQKQRIITFVNPLTDIQGAGYNAYQSTIAVGSGEVLGRGVGYGTQSRLEFLPEYETDFIFAAFAEEWGFVGVLLLFALFGIVIWRVLHGAFYGVTNFEVLFGVGLAILFISHFIIHIGMNVGLLPVTGATLPFMSYGGSHLITEFGGLGMLMGMRRFARAAHRDDIKNEYLGI